MKHRFNYQHVLVFYSWTIYTGEQKQDSHKTALFIVTNIICLVILLRLDISQTKAVIQVKIA